MSASRRRYSREFKLEVVRRVQEQGRTQAQVAEELGVSSANVDEMKGSSTDPNVRRLLGIEGVKGEWMGVPDEWGYSIVKHVGNYGEAFERNVGKDSALGISRGLNALWSKGGLQYAPPIR